MVFGTRRPRLTLQSKAERLALEFGHSKRVRRGRLTYIIARSAE
jgi:hypothetical protein